MEAISILLLLVVVTMVVFIGRRWLGGRLSPLKDHSKKQEEADGVEIIVQKPAHERRLKLTLPDFSSVQIRSPVGPMKSSIRSALKELRSRQMVQSLCSKFESRLKVPNEDKHIMSKKPLLEIPQAVQPAKTRRRDATVAPVLLANTPVKEMDITGAARSNNLNKFLRSYASNLDKAIIAERSVVMVAEPDSDSDVEEDNTVPQSVVTPETSMQTTIEDSSDLDMELELDLPPLQLEPEHSNQCDSADGDADVSVLIEATELIDDSFEEEGNNHFDTTRSSVVTVPSLSKAFTPSDYITIEDVSKQAAPEMTREQSKRENCIAPPTKNTLEKFQQQVPANSRRLHTLQL